MLMCLLEKHRHRKTRREMSCYTEGCGQDREHEVMGGPIEKRESPCVFVACFVVCWLIPGPTGPAVPLRQTTSLPSLTFSWIYKQQTFMFDESPPGIWCHWWRVTRTYESSSSRQEVTRVPTGASTESHFMSCHVGCPQKGGYSPALGATKVKVDLSSSVSCWTVCSLWFFKFTFVSLVFQEFFIVWSFCDG